MRDFRRMVIIRSPYSRTLSAFLHRFRRQHFREAFGKFSLDPEGFGDFVKWLDDGGLSKNGHWDLQTKEILLPLEHYTDVLRLEALGEALPRFFHDTGLDETAMERSGVNEFGRVHDTNASAKVRRFYNDESRATVARLYATDFEALGYDPDTLD